MEDVKIHEYTITKRFFGWFAESIIYIKGVPSYSVITGKRDSEKAVSILSPLYDGKETYFKKDSIKASIVYSCKRLTKKKCADLHWKSLDDFQKYTVDNK